MNHLGISALSQPQLALNLETWTLRRIPPEQLAVFHRLSDAWNCVVGAMGDLGFAR